MSLVLLIFAFTVFEARFTECGDKRVTHFPPFWWTTLQGDIYKCQKISRIALYM